MAALTQSFPPAAEKQRHRNKHRRRLPCGSTKEKNNKTKIIIAVLSVLLGVSLCALAGTLIYNHVAQQEPASVVVPDNIITPEEETPGQSDSTSGSEEPSDGDSTAPSDSDPTTGTTDVPENTDNSTSTSSPPQEDVIATALQLHNKQSGDNEPFYVGNMFPGDSETKYYCVQVSHKGTVTVRLKAAVQPGYEKLAEVLKARVILLTTGETLYDGLMKDMPDSVNHTLCLADGQTTATDELYYEITAYLETSVGNEYMEQELKADFKWWVEETENLDSPQTGDNSNLTLWICLMLGSLFMIILLAGKRKKEEEQYAK